VIAVWCVVALAGELEGMRPAAAPWSVQESYDTHRVAQDLPKQTLACQVLWPELARLCVREWTDGRRSWLSVDAAEAGGVDLPSVHTSFVDASANRISKDLERVEVQGFSQVHYRLRDGDGWAVAGVLAPQAVARKLDAPMVFAAMPSTGVFVAWVPGDPEFDQVMAVGVREIYDAASDRVSPVVMRWESGQWNAYAEAKPVQSVQPSPSGD